MIKIRNRRIAMLLVLTMLATLFVGVGTASAADILSVNGSYKYVEADDNQTPGSIAILEGEDYKKITSDETIETIYAEVTLPEGVSFAKSGDESFRVTGDSLGNLEDAINTKLADEKLDIESDFTGSVTVEVEIWAVNDSNETIYNVSDNAVIAKISGGDTTVTAKSAKSVAVGINKKGAAITVKESSPGALSEGGEINLTLKANDVEFSKIEVGGDKGLLGAPDKDDTNYTYKVEKKSEGYRASITFTPYFNVRPGADGDIVVKVSGKDIETTEFTVATVGEGSVAIEVDKADKDTVYLGQYATLDDVEINLDPSANLNDDDYITITLPDGLKWASEDDWKIPNYMNDDKQKQDTVVDLSNDSKLEVNGLYNNDRSLWLNVRNGQTVDADFDITDLKIVADADAEVGDLEVTFGGAAEGTYTIGKVAAPFTITAEPTIAPLNGNNVKGGKITITEADDGALIETTDPINEDADKEKGKPGCFDIILPMGVTFADTPDVEVIDGDLKIGDVELSDNEDVLLIQIEKTSNVPSIIEITNVVYDIDNRASEGEFIAKVGKKYNLVSSAALASVKLGTIGNAVGESVFTFGSTTYTLNGVEKTMDVAPYAKNNRTYMPIRYVAYALGINDANIFWDQASQSVTLMKGDKVVQLKLGSKVMTVNGAPITMDVAVEASNDRTFLPAAWVCQAFGATATWDAETNTVTIK